MRYYTEGNLPKKRAKQTIGCEIYVKAAQSRDQFHKEKKSLYELWEIAGETKY